MYHHTRVIDEFSVHYEPDKNAYGRNFNLNTGAFQQLASCNQIPTKTTHYGILCRLFLIHFAILVFTALLSGPSPIDSWSMFSNDKKHLKHGQGVSFIQQLNNYLTTPVTTIKKDFLCSRIVIV